MGSSASEADAASSGEYPWSDLLGIVVGGSHALGGAVWKTDSGTPRLMCQQGLGEQRLDVVHQNWPGHAGKLAEVIREKQSQTLSARFEQHDAVAQDLQLMFVPIRRNGHVQTVVELFFPQGSSTSLDQIEQTVQGLIEWNARVPGAESGTQGSRDFAVWLTQVHARLDLHETCTALADESRVWSGWDRCSVVIGAPQWRVMAVSGLDEVDPRAGAVRELQQLARAVANQPEVVLFGLSHGKDQQKESPPDGVRRYVERTEVERLAVIPLFEKGAQHVLIGVLVFEDFRSGKAIRTPSDLELLAPHASVALQHALDYDSASQPWWRRAWKGATSRRLARWTLAAVLLVGIGLALALWPAAVAVSGTGVLEPEQQRDVFARANGIVDKLLVTHGQQVKQGQALLQLRSPELDFERNRLEGELSTVQQQIEDLATLRIDPARRDSPGQTDNELAARAEELKAVERSLRRQIEVVELRIAELTIESPTSGQVLTWELETLLTNRPVNRTDRLLTIARLDGPWVARLNVDHRDSGPVLAAAREDAARVTFVTADHPDKPHAAQIREIAPAVEFDTQSRGVLTVTAEVNRSDLKDVRPRTIVQYRIDCGTAPVGYVWFRRLIDRVMAWWALF